MNFSDSFQTDFKGAINVIWPECLRIPSKNIHWSKMKNPWYFSGSILLQHQRLQKSVLLHTVEHVTDWYAFSWLAESTYSILFLRLLWCVCEEANSTQNGFAQWDLSGTILFDFFTPMREVWLPLFYRRWWWLLEGNMILHVLCRRKLSSSSSFYSNFLLYTLS